MVEEMLHLCAIKRSRLYSQKKNPTNTIVPSLLLDLSARSFRALELVH